MNLRFPFAYEGTKTLFTAGVLEFIGSLLYLGALLLILINPLAGAIVSMFFVFAGLILQLLAVIFRMIGIYKTGRDEPLSAKAFILAVIALILSVGRIFFKGNLRTVLDLAALALSLVITMMVFTGLIRLFEHTGSAAAAASGRVLRIVFAAAIIVSDVCSLLLTGRSGLSGYGPYVGIALGAFAASIIAYVAYLKFLAGARNELESLRQQNNTY